MAWLELIGLATLVVLTLWAAGWWLDRQRWFHDFTSWVRRTRRKAKGFEVAIGNEYWANDFAYEPDRLARSKPDLIRAYVRFIPIPGKWRLALLRFPEDN